MNFSEVSSRSCEAHCDCFILEIYKKLPLHVQRLADAKFKLLKQNPKHLSLHFKQIGRFWTARVGMRYRTIAVEEHDSIIWFWIGTHDEYDRLIAVMD